MENYYRPLSTSPKIQQCFVSSPANQKELSDLGSQRAVLVRIDSFKVTSYFWSDVLLLFLAN